jgi:S1-C subfamily serine protease
MRYLIGGFLSLLVACNTPSFGVCPEQQMQDKMLVLKSESRVENKSRAAVVKVFSERKEGTGFGTGTVFIYRGKTVILTAAHVVGGLENRTTVSDGTRKVEAQVVYLDIIADLAVLTVSEQLDRKPLSLRPVKKSSFNLGEDVFYSGFPNDSSLLTIRGYIAGMHPGEHLYMHSYGWPGASGSAVLDRHGRLVGVLFAVDVGTNIVGFPTIIEDIVVVVPIWKMNFDLLDMNLR